MIIITEEKEIQYIERYSFSKLNSFDPEEGCLHSWKCTYKDSNRGIGNAWSSWGLAYHDLIKEYFNNDIFLFEFKDKYLQEIKKCQYKFPKFARVDLNEKILNGIMNHIDNFHFFDKYNFLEYETEYFFEFEGKQFIMIPDAVGYTPEKDFVILDHKISKIWPKKEVQKKKRQLYLYSIGIKEKYDKLPNHFQINFFKDDEIIKYDFVESEFEETKDWMRKQLELIEKETEYKPRCEMVKDKTKDFYALYLCNQRRECEFRPYITQN